MSHLRRVEIDSPPDSPLFDYAGRLRASLPFTVFDQIFRYRIGSLFWSDDVLGGGSSIAHLPNEGSVLLTAGTGATDHVYRQTLEYPKYRPGKSHFPSLTFTFGAAVANLRRRAGYFDAGSGALGDGVFLEQNGTTDVALVLRSSVSGSRVDTRVVQSAWNLDRLNGSGVVNPSGLTLDLSKNQVMFIDLLWYGSDGVRVGLRIGGRTINVHRFSFANVGAVPYMTTGSLPIRFEIENLAGQGVAHTLRQGCSAVTTEDGDPEIDLLTFTANTGTTKHAVTTRRALISIRPKAAPGGVINRATIRAVETALLVGTNDALIEIVYNPTFTGTPVWLDPTAEANTEYSIHTDAANGAITGGTVLHSFYAASGVGVAAHDLRGALRNRWLPVALDMNGANPRALSVVATSMSGTSNIAAALDFGEIR